MEERREGCAVEENYHALKPSVIGGNADARRLQIFKNR
jgi:hypothetical protein